MLRIVKTLFDIGDSSVRLNNSDDFNIWTSIESIASERPRVRLVSKFNRESRITDLRAMSRRYIAISIAVIPAIIAVIDHSARGRDHWREKRMHRASTRARRFTPRA